MPAIAWRPLPEPLPTRYNNPRPRSVGHAQSREPLGPQQSHAVAPSRPLLLAPPPGPGRGRAGDHRPRGVLGQGTVNFRASVLRDLYSSPDAMAPDEPGE